MATKETVHILVAPTEVAAFSLKEAQELTRLVLRSLGVQAVRMDVAIQDKEEFSPCQVGVAGKRSFQVQRFP